MCLLVDLYFIFSTMEKIYKVNPCCDLLEDILKPNYSAAYHGQSMPIHIITLKGGFHMRIRYHFHEWIASKALKHVQK